MSVISGALALVTLCHSHTHPPTAYCTFGSRHPAYCRYADNDAIGYFRKQGFTKTITLPKRATHGYIKDYDGGTQMQCVLHPGVDYLRLPQMIARQRSAVVHAIQARQTWNKTFPGLAMLETGKSVPIGNIAGVKEAGWRPSDTAPKITPAKSDKVLNTTLRQLHRDLKQHPSAWPFLAAVDVAEVRAYPAIHTASSNVLCFHVCDRAEVPYGCVSRLHSDVCT